MYGMLHRQQSLKIASRSHLHLKVPQNLQHPLHWSLVSHTCTSLMLTVSKAATLAPAGLTKMVSKLAKEGAYKKGLEVYHTLIHMSIMPDTAITNAAISACDKGEHPTPAQLSACTL